MTAIPDPGHAAAPAARVGADGGRDVAASRPAGSASGCSSACPGRLARSSPTSGRSGPVPQRVLAARPVHVARRPRVHPRQLRRAVRHPCIGRSTSGRSGWRRLVTVDLHRPGLPDRLLHGPGRVAAAPGPARRRGPHAALGELPHQGLFVAADPRRATACLTGCSRRSASRARVRRRAAWLTFTYLWLPYMILPIFAGLERIP